MVTVSGKIEVSVKQVVSVEEDGNVVGAPRIIGSISGFLEGKGGSKKINNVTYTTTDFGKIDVSKGVSSWTGGEDYHVSVFCSNTVSGGGSATLTINVHYSIKPGSSNGSIDVTVSGLS